MPRDLSSVIHIYEYAVILYMIISVNLFLPM